MHFPGRSVGNWSSMELGKISKGFADKGNWYKLGKLMETFTNYSNPCCNHNFLKFEIVVLAGNSKLKLILFLV